MRPLHPLLAHPSLKSALLKAAGLGAVSAAAGFFVAPARFWADLLLAGFFALSLSLGAMVFLAVQLVTDSRWSRPFQRVTEALASGLWVGLALTALAVGLGGGSLYGWAHPGHGHLPHSQELWLSRPFQLARLAVYAAVWLGFGSAMMRSAAAGPAARFLVAFAVTFSAASMDWIMTLEPRWYSTIFGIYLFAGSFLGALAAIAVMVAALRRTEALARRVSEETYHDLGKLLFGFSCFWAYIWFCQFLLIWYTNIPEETGFFAVRAAGAWGLLTALAVASNWIVPFFALMTRRAKSEPKVLFRVGVCLLFGRWLDLFVLVLPRFSAHGPELAGWEAGLFAGGAALLGWAVARNWTGRTADVSGRETAEKAAVAG